MTLPELGTAAANVALVLLTVIVAVVVVFQAVNRLAFARLELQDIVAGDDKIDLKGMREIIRSELVQLRDEGADSSPFMVSGPDAPLQLPDMVKTTQLDMLAQVINWLPGRITTVSAYVQAEAGNGLGISLALVGPFGRPKGSVTIWEKDLNLPTDIAPLSADVAKAERCQRLAVAAAAWIAYRLLGDMSPAARLPLLTQDWRSYTVFRVAARMQRQGARTDVVRAMYQIALRFDPRNRGALFNLGNVYAEDLANQMAMQALAACEEEVRGLYQHSDDWRFDRLWYRARFNDGVARANEATLRQSRDAAGRSRTSRVPGAAIPEDFGFRTHELQAQAKERFAEVARTADRTIRDLAGGRDVAELGKRGELVRFLVEVRSLGAVAYQGMP